MTNIIYLFGNPGTGKYTIAEEIAKAGYIICDNQLINNPVFELLKYDRITTQVSRFWLLMYSLKSISACRTFVKSTKIKEVISHFLL